LQAGGSFHPYGDAAWPLATHDAVLRQIRRQRVDPCGSLSHKQITGLVEHQHRLLIDTLDRYELSSP